MKLTFKNTVIDSFAYDLPQEILTSEAIEARLDATYKRLNLPQGRLELMSGIKERRVWPIGTLPSSLSIKAAEKVMAKTQLKKEDIGVLIHSSVCRDFLEPATAAVVHDHLRLSENCEFFDLSNACLGVLHSITMVARMIEGGQVSAGLVVAGENAGPLIEKTIQELLENRELTRKEIKKYMANLTLGSAAVAFLISDKKKSPHGHQVLGGALKVDSEAHKLCRGGGDIQELMMETQSEAMLLAGITLAKKTWEESCLNVQALRSPQMIIGHQVGVAHEEKLLSQLDLKEVSTYSTYETLGNTGSAALPITFAKCSEQDGLLKKGDVVGLLGIGSGLSSLMLGVKW